MDFNGLSIEQAPPISAPLRFFLTAPIFAIVAGFLILFSDAESLINRYSMESIVVTHAITIGFFSFVMLGALTQMLPVLAGAKIPKVGSITKYSYLLLVFGTIFMLVGLLNLNATLITISTLSLGSGFLILIAAIGLAILGVKNFTATVKAMSISLIFATFTVLMGLYLLSSYIMGTHSQNHQFIADIHSVWGIFGFAGILIIGVSFQVLPMFYVAPRFKKFCKKKVIWLIPIGLLLWLFFNLFYENIAIYSKIMVSLFFLAFATAVWIKISARRRKVSDITIWYWRAATIFLGIGVFLWVFDQFLTKEYIVLVSIFIGGGFILCIMQGMLYKIIPFLVWFHLNAMGYMSIPTMNEMIDKKLTKIQFFLFMFSLLGFIISFFIPQFLVLFASTFILSMIILEYNIVQPVLVYIKTKKTKPDFDMGAFGTN